MKLGDTEIGFWIQKNESTNDLTFPCGAEQRFGEKNLNLQFGSGEQSW